MYYIEIALSLMWLGALLTYLASASQQLIAQSIPKVFAWSLLCVFIGLSSYLLSYQYAMVTSLLFSLGVLLFAWIALILIAGHWRPKLLSVTSFGVVIAIIFAQFGGV